MDSSEDRGIGSSDALVLCQPAGAHVHREARIDPSASVLDGAVVERGAIVGARTVVQAGAVLRASGEEAEEYKRFVADCLPRNFSCRLKFVGSEPSGFMESA